MGHEAIYECNQCKKTFTAFEGGGNTYEEYRCVACDEITQVMTMDRTVPKEEYVAPTAEEIGTCFICEGELRLDLLPMCKPCKSRDVKLKMVVNSYD